MAVDRHGVGVALGGVAVRVAVWLGAFPAFVRVLMVFVVNVQMLVPQCWMFVRQRLFVDRPPEPCRGQGAGGAEPGYDEERGAQAEARHRAGRPAVSGHVASAEAIPHPFCPRRAEPTGSGLPIGGCLAPHRRRRDSR